MHKQASTKQQINTELAIRGVNQRAKRVIEHHTPGEEQSGLKIDFYCECSDADCHERVTMSLEEYESLHNNQAQFIIVKGHQSPQVEKIVKTKGDIQVVQKYAL